MKNNGAAGAMKKEHKLSKKGRRAGGHRVKIRGKFLPLRKLVTTSELVYGLCFLYIK